MSRTQILAARKLVAYRLMASQLRQLEKASDVLGKSKTAIVEQAIAMYINSLHIQGVL